MIPVSFFAQAFSDLALADVTERDASLTSSPRRWVLATAATLVLTTTADALRGTGVVPRRPLQPTKLTSVPSRPTNDRRRSCALLCSDSAVPVLAEVQLTLDPIISDLKTRIASAPQGLQGNEESRLQAEEDSTLSRLLFEVDGDGNLVGEPEEEGRLAQALSRSTMVLVRVACPRAVADLSRLNSAANALLGEDLPVDDKLATFGPMREHERGVVTGYAGGGDYGSDQFLETRGRGPGTLVPEMDAEAAARVIEGRQALSRISLGVLRAIARQTLTLPEIDANAFLDLVDAGEGGGTAASFPQGQLLSSSPLRLCRYAGSEGGVAFGAHTDTTFLTAIPCASVPGLEILQPDSGRWWRPEAASSCRPGADVMLLTGEIFQALGRGLYRAAVHRVVRPADPLSSQPRVSTPLLLRGAADATVHDSLLSPPRQTRPRPNVDSINQCGEQKVTMASLWAALQFRGGEMVASGEEEDGDANASGNRIGRCSSIALARNLAGEDGEIRRAFAPFAAGGVTVLSSDPLLVRLHGFASRAECDAIVTKVSTSSSLAGGLETSTTWLDADAQQDGSSGLRRSSTCWIADGALPLFAELTERVSGISRLPSGFMEKWQVARYKPHGFFKLHTDHLEAFNDLRCGGRLGTLILYLNDDFRGGHTKFPSLGVSVKPVAGDAIYFHNVKVPVEQHEAGNMVADQRSAHAGLCVEAGDKWIATKWLHPLPYPNGVVGPETQ